MNTSIILATVLCLLCTILTEWVHDNLAKQTFILPLTSKGKVVASRCPLTLGVSVTLSSSTHAGTEIYRGGDLLVTEDRASCCHQYRCQAGLGFLPEIVPDVHRSLSDQKHWCAIYQPQTMTEKPSYQYFSCRQPGGQACVSREYLWLTPFPK